jgi:hypothetical protein
MGPGGRAFMRFLYRCAGPRLENLCTGWHLSTRQEKAAIGLAPADDTAQEQLMLDVFMVALGLGFFVAAVSYAYACERL